MPICKSCVLLPEPHSRDGFLHLAIPSLITEEQVANWFSSRGIDCSASGTGLLSIPISGTLLDEFVEGLPNLTTPHELEEIRVLQTEGEMVVTALHVLRMERANVFIEKIKGEWLTELLRTESVSTYFQPIVDMQSNHVYAHECLLRGIRGSQVVPPNEVFGTASNLGLMFHLDKLARISAIRNAHAAGLHSNIFINFNPTAIYQPEACLQTTVQAARESGIPPHNIVFEVVESEEVRDVDFLKRVLDFYRNAGFRVALDDMGAGFSGLNLLNDLKPDFIKLDMQLIRDVHLDPYKQQIAKHMLQLAQELGIQSVVEGLECAGEWEWAKAHGATLAQGYFFAKPSAIPATRSDNSYFLAAA